MNGRTSHHNTVTFSQPPSTECKRGRNKHPAAKIYAQTSKRSVAASSHLASHSETVSSHERNRIVTSRNTERSAESDTIQRTDVTRSSANQRSDRGEQTVSANQRLNRGDQAVSANQRSDRGHQTVSANQRSDRRDSHGDLVARLAARERRDRQQQEKERWRQQRLGEIRRDLAARVLQRHWREILRQRDVEIEDVVQSFRRRCAVRRITNAWIRYNFSKKLTQEVQTIQMHVRRLLTSLDNAADWKLIGSASLVTDV